MLIVLFVPCFVFFYCYLNKYAVVVLSFYCYSICNNYNFFNKLFINYTRDSFLIKILIP